MSRRLGKGAIYFGVRSEIDLYVGPNGLEITTPVQRDVVLVG